MGTITLPFIEKNKSKGRIYFRYRRQGHRLKLPSDPASPEFIQRYNQIHESFENPREELSAAPGSVRGLINDFRASAEFKELKPTVQKMYMFYLGLVAEKIGKYPARHFKSRHALTWQDELADTPAKANNVMAAISRVYAFGKRRGFVDHNPASGIKKLKVGEWRAWTPEEISKFNEVSTDSIRVAFHLALYTGQRISDVIRMRWNQIVDGGIEVTQQKTGTKIWIPVHYALQETLRTAWETKADSVMILTSKTGIPYKADYLKKQFKKAIRAAGLPEDCVFHGLRKTAAALLAEAGCSTEQIKSITGHRTDQMAAYYAKQANQRVMARAAMDKFEGRSAQPLLAKLPNSGI